MTKTQRSFHAVKQYVCSIYPALRRIKLRHCMDVEREHEASWRQFAHSIHVNNSICYSYSMEELEEAQRQGIFMHEFGHIFCDKYPYLWPDNEDEDADQVCEEEFGVPIFYDRESVEFVILPLGSE